MIPSRRRYRTFQSKCWHHVTRKCHEDELCISTLSQQDLICSGSDDCKAAYIGIFGTVLQVQCTCRTVTQSEESLCKIFQHMLHRRSCFGKLYIFTKLYTYFFLSVQHKVIIQHRKLNKDNFMFAIPFYFIFYFF